jgi:hypothetical protein
MEHLNNLAESGPRSLSDLQTFIRSAFMPLGSATWPALGPDPFTPPFCCGHGWTMIPLEQMLHLISEQVYAVRHYAGSHPHGAPAGRLGFSWQPTNNFQLPPADGWPRGRRRGTIASAIHYATGRAVRPPRSVLTACEQCRLVHRRRRRGRRPSIPLGDFRLLELKPKPKARVNN